MHFYSIFISLSLSTHPSAYLSKIDIIIAFSFAFQVQSKTFIVVLMIKQFSIHISGETVIALGSCFVIVIDGIFIYG